MDRNSSGGGKIVYILNGIIVKRLHVYETQNQRAFVQKLLLRIGSGEFYLPTDLPIPDLLKLIFEETTQSENQLPSKFGNIVITGDFDIDTGSKSCNKFKQFADFCDTFDLINLINAKTCFQSATSQSHLDVILTNRPRSFQKTAAITTGRSYYHKMIITTFRSSYTREPPRIIIYRNYKNFNAQDFLNDLETNLKLEEQASTCVCYDKLTKTFKESTGKLHNRRSKRFRATKLSKQIMRRSKSENLSSYKQIHLGQLHTIPSQTKTLILVIPFFNQKIYLKRLPQGCLLLGRLTDFRQDKNLIVNMLTLGC